MCLCNYDQRTEYLIEVLCPLMTISTRAEGRRCPMHQPAPTSLDQTPSSAHQPISIMGRAAWSGWAGRRWDPVKELAMDS
ncbi:hypothetical protein E2C01_020020 [Portunus trituberculatus]|uniref:Uncharacterized protein n=1 Tax=Portunus trituberculatus TaxID=210409 RepID=A0A5B7E0D6_PORTR|nr:hypothetical protein [Portunus trituberculatus]